MMSGGGPWVLLGVLLVLVLVVGYLVVRSGLASARRSESAADRQRRLGGQANNRDEDGALGILRARYARGEIEVEEYEQRLEPLLREHPTHEPG
jgi:uncharacterized membrane protein